MHYCLCSDSSIRLLWRQCRQGMFWHTPEIAVCCLQRCWGGLRMVDGELPSRKKQHTAWKYMFGTKVYLDSVTSEFAASQQARSSATVHSCIFLNAPTLSAFRNVRTGQAASQKCLLPRRSRVATGSDGVADLWQLEASHADERQSAAYS